MEITKELKEKLLNANSEEEVKALLGDEVTLEDAAFVWEKLQAKKAEGALSEVDDDELEAVSGGADRDWEKDGCRSSTDLSFCWVSDSCLDIWTTYSNYDPCPKGGKHEWQEKVLIDWLRNSQGVFFECKKCHEKTEVKWSGNT